jgi:hypothetical protein
MIMTNICMSGGAEGADLEWGAAAVRAEHQVIHWSFAGHRTRAPKEQVVILTEDELRQAEVHLGRANRVLGRRFPPASTYALNLLRRDWFQAAKAEAAYAVTELSQQGQVKGGSAWAIQMLRDCRPDAPVYLFEQNLGIWLMWRDGWRTAGSTPPPRGIWAGIGTRALNECGRAAIHELMGR